MVKRLLTVLSYLLVAILVVVATVVLVAIAKGYSYDVKTGRISLKGLLVLNSTPQGATILFDGAPIRRKTPYRATLEAGSYRIEVRKDGFRTWQKRLVVNPSEVTFVPYSLLLPTEIKTNTLIGGRAASQLSATPDRRHFAYVTTGSDPGVWTLNFDRREGTKRYTPRPADPALGRPAEVIESVTWADDGSRLLVKSLVGAAPVYTLVGTNGGATALNLTELFRFDFSGLAFSPNNSRELYWMSPEGLRRLDAEARTVSAVLADKVSAFTFAGDRILYVQTTPLGKTVWSMDRSGRDPKRLIESLAESDSYEMAYVNVRGKDYLAVLPHKATTASVYIDIFSATPTVKVVSKSAQHIKFSEDGRFLAFYSGDTFGTYDTEKDVIAATATSNLTDLTWYDGFHVLLNRQGRLHLAEFDGANMTEISAAAGPAYSTNDHRFVVALRPPARGGQGFDIISAEIKR
ncbi:PEGA domain-containing protein [Candidatus Parcubacteria bacterium]|nr:PEGA domain-containing protein [Candidatus Parcubacteria bacterium]